MLTNKRGLISTYRAEVDIPANTAVTYGTGATEVKLAVVDSQRLGVTTEIDASAGEPVDVVLTGIAPVRYGAAVAVGDKLTTDAAGRAIKATKATNILGTALVAGAVDEIGSINLDDIAAPNPATP